jgi:hypothetical protein
MQKNSIVIAAALALTAVAPMAFANDGDFPRTADGKPDFTGRYDISSLTPFQRSEEFGERLFLTEEEANAMASRAAISRENGAKSSNPEREAPKVGGNVGAYNDFWFEWGSQGFAIDGKFRTSILTEPANGRMPERTEAGRLRQAGAPRFAWKNLGEAWWLESGDTPYDGPEDMVLGVRCLYQPSASVPIRPLPYNNLKTIVQTDSHVMIHIEWMHWTRVVRMDSEHPPSHIRSLAGDSIGHWEGDTLVIETTNFLQLPNVAKEGFRVVERFSPVSAEGLLYQFTVEDPEYTATYGGELLWPKTESKSYEYACHEGNYAMGNTLRGARLLEREWREKQAASSGE